MSYTLNCVKTNADTNPVGKIYLIQRKDTLKTPQEEEFFLWNGFEVKKHEGLFVITQTVLRSILHKWNMHVKNIDFSNCFFYHVDFKNATFHNCNFSNAYFYENKIRNCVFDICNFYKSTIQIDALESTFSSCSFDGVHISQSTLRDCSFLNCFFILAHFKSGCFRNSILSKNHFLIASMDGTEFSSCKCNDNYELDTLSITMGGATSSEVNRYKERLLFNLKNTA